MTEKIQDFFHWIATIFLGWLGFVIDNGNEIVIVCAVLSAVLQVIVQFKRARKG